MSDETPKQETARLWGFDRDLERMTIELDAARRTYCCECKRSLTWKEDGGEWNRGHGHGVAIRCLDCAMVMCPACSARHFGQKYMEQLNQYLDVLQSRSAGERELADLRARVATLEADLARVTGERDAALAYAERHRQAHIGETGCALWGDLAEAHRDLEEARFERDIYIAAHNEACRDWELERRDLEEVRRLLRDCVDGWRKGVDTVGPMQVAIGYLDRLKSEPADKTEKPEQ